MNREARLAKTPFPFPRKDTDVFYRDTWVWNGTDWTQRNPAQAPSERALHAMAYDAARKQVALFDGFSREGKALLDTWLWDGTTWKKMNPVNIPPARIVAAMAYDPTHHQIVMFGGMDLNLISTGHYVFDDTCFGTVTTGQRRSQREIGLKRAAGPAWIMIEAIIGWCGFPGTCTVQQELVRLGSTVGSGMEATGQSWPDLNLDCFSSSGERCCS